MTRVMHRPARPIRTLCRNVAALTVAATAVGYLALCEETTAGHTTPAVNLAQLTADLSPGETAADANSPQVLEGRAALEKNLELLDAGYRRVAGTPAYTAVMLRQERVGDAMSEQEVMQLKLRHEPLGIYMKWIAGEHDGREVLFVENENDGQMLVKLDGMKGRLLPALKVDPHGSLAMAHSRHAITETGLLHLIESLREHVRRDLQGETSVRCTLVDGRQFGGRDCYWISREYADQADSLHGYRKSTFSIDKELLVPVAIQNYAWPEGDDADLTPEQRDAQTLVEVFAYTDIQFHPRLADRDFDRDNAKYAFRR